MDVTLANHLSGDKNQTLVSQWILDSANKQDREVWGPYFCCLFVCFVYECLCVNRGFYEEWCVYSCV